jgi:hypothetical protein
MYIHATAVVVTQTHRRCSTRTAAALVFSKRPAACFRAQKKIPGFQKCAVLAEAAVAGHLSVLAERLTSIVLGSAERAPASLLQILQKHTVASLTACKQHAGRRRLHAVRLRPRQRVYEAREA